MERSIIFPSPQLSHAWLEAMIAYLPQTQHSVCHVAVQIIGVFFYVLLLSLQVFKGFRSAFLFFIVKREGRHALVYTVRYACTDARRGTPTCTNIQTHTRAVIQVHSCTLVAPPTRAHARRHARGHAQPRM